MNTPPKFFTPYVPSEQIPAGFDDSMIDCQSCNESTPNCTSDDGMCPPCVKGNALEKCEDCPAKIRSAELRDGYCKGCYTRKRYDF